MQKEIWMEGMGNLHNSTFDEIWNSEQARKVRDLVGNCPKNCWMIGSAGPAIKHYLAKSTRWVIAHKALSLWHKNQNSGT